MPRRAPFDPQGIYHVSTRGNFGAPLWETPDQHELYLKLFAQAAREFAWVVVDWVLLWNHHHFVIRLTEDGLSEGMRKVNHSYARRINAINGVTGNGHLVRHGFFARQILSDDQLITTCRYVDLNAVTANQCRRPDRWRWGGYRAAMGLAYPEPFHHVGELLSLFGPTPSKARSAYRRFVLDSLEPFPGNGDEGVTPRGARVVESAA